MCKHAIILGRVLRTSWKLGVWFLLAVAMVHVTHGAPSVTLAWNPNTETDLAGYNVYVGTKSGVYTNRTNVGNVTSNAVNGLVVGATYYFAVTAYNTAGAESDYSAEVSYQVPSGTNRPPALLAITNRTVLEDAGVQPVALSGISSGGTNEIQTLTVTATSSNPSLIPNPVVTYTSPATTGMLSFASLTNASGTATITVTVNDGQTTNNTASQSFVVTVTAVNDAPTFSVGSSQVVGKKNTSLVLSGLSVADPDAASGNLSLHLTVLNGKLLVATNVAGGLSAAQITANNTADIWISAPLAAINVTLGNSNGVVYSGNVNFVGNDTLAISVNDNGNTGVGGALSTIAQKVIALRGDNLDTWRAQWFSQADLADPTQESTTWGDNADPDNDGRDNLMEFALGLNPLKKDANKGFLETSVVDVAGSKYAALTFRRRQNEPLLQYIPEVSADGQVWSSGPSFVKQTNTTSIDGTFESVVYQDLTPVSSTSPRFFRLRVTKNEL